MTLPPSATYTVRSLVKTYRTRSGDEVRANDGIELTIGRGEVFGLLGPNGAGKSTLVRQLIGLLTPDAGSVTLYGEPVNGRPDLVSRWVAYLAQTEPVLDEVSVVTAVETTGRLRGLGRSASRHATAELLEELGLGDVATRPLGKLSGGRRRLAGVATALIGERPVLVLDEPTTGLDPVARRAVWSALQRRRAETATTIVLVTHNVVEAESVLDRVAVLDAGRVIACDTPGRLKALVSEEVRLELVWRAEPPYGAAPVDELARRAQVAGRRWTTHLPRQRARELLASITEGPLLDALDDFTLSTPSLEDVYLALGGHATDLERV